MNFLNNKTYNGVLSGNKRRVCAMRGISIGLSFVSVLALAGCCNSPGDLCGSWTGVKTETPALNIVRTQTVTLDIDGDTIRRILTINYENAANGRDVNLTGESEGSFVVSEDFSPKRMDVVNISNTESPSAQRINSAADISGLSREAVQAHFNEAFLATFQPKAAWERDGDTLRIVFGNAATYPPSVDGIFLLTLTN